MSELRDMAKKILDEHLQQVDEILDKAMTVEIPPNFFDEYGMEHVARMVAHSVMYELDWRFKSVRYQQLRRFSYDVMTNALGEDKE